MVTIVVGGFPICPLRCLKPLVNLIDTVLLIGAVGVNDENAFAHDDDLPPELFLFFVFSLLVSKAALLLYSSVAAQL